MTRNEAIGWLRSIDKQLQSEKGGFKPESFDELRHKSLIIAINCLKREELQLKALRRTE